MAVAMKELLTTRVCALTGAYPFVLCMSNSKKIRLIKVEINGLRPTLTIRILLLFGKQEGNS